VALGHFGGKELKLPSALNSIRDLTIGTEWENDLFIVGGAVRDQCLGGGANEDFDLVTRGSAVRLAEFLYEQGLAEHFPVTYARFGTAMVKVADVTIELITARRESYQSDSRKPDVEPSTYLEDALRRDFTVNSLRIGVHDGQLVDTLGTGLPDLEAKVLRTPKDPAETFFDDPLRMLRAVRFRHRLGFRPADGLYEAIVSTSERLAIVSKERIRDEFLKILAHFTAAEALEDLRHLRLWPHILPEVLDMVDVEQGKYHHLDVWHHTRLVVDHLRDQPVRLKLAGLLHDIGKPSTRTIDAKGDTRFFGHESVGAAMTETMLRRLMLSERDILAVRNLVKNHMRLGSAPEFSATAARRLVRDLGDQVEDLLTLVEADAASLRPGVQVMDLSAIRARIDDVTMARPSSALESPLTGEQIMALMGIPAGPEVGRLKQWLVEEVLEGRLAPGDTVAAEAALRDLAR